jgi:hypothetical protein
MVDPLERDIAWFADRLVEAEGGALSAALERLRAAVGDPDPRRRPDLAAFTDDEIGRLLTHLAVGFHLRNKAEQHHIVRVNRRREIAATAERPRPESIDEACRLLACWRDADDATRPLRAGLAMLSVNALAAAMQSTG